MKYRLRLIEVQKRFALCQGSWHMTDFKILLVPLHQEHDCFFVIQDLELVYFSEYQIPNSESPAYQERRILIIAVLTGR